MNGLIPKKLTAGFAIAIVVVIENAWISYRNLSQISENELIVAQTTISSTLASLFSLGLLALLYALARRDLSARQQTQIALQERENHLQHVLDAEPECVKVVAVDGTVLEINPAGLTMLEAPNAKAVIGQSVYSLIAPEYQAGFQKMHESVCRGNKETLEFEIINCQGHRRYIETHAVPLPSGPDGTFVQLAVAQDITQRKQAEAELGRLNRTLQTLLDCNQALVRANDELDLLQNICRIIVEEGGYQLAWVGFAEQDAAKTIRPVVHAGSETGYLKHLHLTWADTERGQGPTGTAIRTGQPSVVQNILTEPRYKPWRQEASQRGYAASIALPLLNNQQPFGALNIYAAEPDAFDANEVRLLVELAGDVAFGVAALQNQRDRHLAEIALQESEERLRLALSAAQMGFWDWNVGTNQIIWSDGHERLFGLVPGTFDGTYATFDACLYPDDREALMQAVSLAREQHTDYRHEFRVVWADGSIHWIEGQGEFYYNDAGETVRMLGTVRDISARKHAEEAVQAEKQNLALRVAERTAELLRINQRLQHELDERQKVQADLQMSQAQFAGILDIAEDAIISIDSQQQITLFNQGAEKIFGYAAAEVIGQPLDLLLPSRFASSHRQYVTDFRVSPVQARRMGERREIYGRRKNGSEFPAEASISKFNSGQGTVFTVFLQDITERKQIERMKDEFVSVVSHELRTPLTSIHGSLGMLASGLLKPDSDQGKRMLQIAVESTDRLVRLINDILDIERIESGRVKMEKALCAVDDLITEAINVVQPLADKAGVTLSVTSLPIQVWADPDRIVQTLTNLLSNAIKFSPSGSTVWLTAEMGSGGNEKMRSGGVEASHHPITPSPHYPSLLFTVKDHGRGIPTGKLDSIFERFQQVDSSDSRNHEGTGLGLAICRSIVQQHDGQIWVESILGEGSTFSFTLPLPVHPAIGPSTLLNGSIVAPLVLICDDDDAIREVLQTLLEHQNYHVITTASGQDAIAQAATYHPDVILLDLLMPGMNGWETMSGLKERPETANIPIIIWSICTPTEISPQNPNLPDIDDWVHKPLNEVLLLQSLQQTLAKPTDHIRALIVEDDTDIAHLLVTLFEQHNITAFHAVTGREAIRLSQEINPDLLILDVILPEGDGFTVVEWLRQHNRLRDIPLVVYSARDLDASDRDYLQLGHTEFLDKRRVFIQDFEQRVMTLLHRVTQAEVSQTDASEHGNDNEAGSGC